MHFENTWKKCDFNYYFKNNLSNAQKIEKGHSSATETNYVILPIVSSTNDRQYRMWKGPGWSTGQQIRRIVYLLEIKTVAYANE